MSGIDTWPCLNHHTEPINSQSLDVIERAQLVVCLDQSHPHTSQLQSSDSGAIQDYEKSILANRVLHGNGSKQNSSNRWFDHAVQVGGDTFILNIILLMMLVHVHVHMYVVMLTTSLWHLKSACTCTFEVANQYATCTCMYHYCTDEADLAKTVGYYIHVVDFISVTSSCVLVMMVLLVLCWSTLLLMDLLPS